MGWYGGNSENRTHRVGGLPANRWKLHDLHGQVWEWAASLWRPDHTSEAENPDPVGGVRVLRGGCGGVSADDCRSAFRSGFWPGDRYWYIGFRVRLPAPEPD